MSEARIKLQRVLMSKRLSVCDESKMQNAIERRLQEAGIDYVREKTLTTGRIDFAVVIDGERIGVECKVDGSELAAFRQVIAYATTGEFDSMVIVTGKPFVGIMDQIEANGKRLPVEIWKVRTL